MKLAMKSNRFVAAWRGAPWTLRIFAVAGVLGLLTAVLYDPRERVYWLVWLAITLVAVYFMFRGVRWVWFAVIGVMAFFVLTFLVLSHPNKALWDLIYITLLLAPPTRRHFATPRG